MFIRHCLLKACDRRRFSPRVGSAGEKRRPAKICGRRNWLSSNILRRMRCGRHPLRFHHFAGKPRVPVKAPRTGLHCRVVAGSGSRRRPLLPSKMRGSAHMFPDSAPFSEIFASPCPAGSYNSKLAQTAASHGTCRSKPGDDSAPRRTNRAHSRRTPPAKRAGETSRAAQMFFRGRVHFSPALKRPAPPTGVAGGGAPARSRHPTGPR